jgi:hypothetical protein
VLSGHTQAMGLLMGRLCTRGLGQRSCWLNQHLRVSNGYYLILLETHTMLLEMSCTQTSQMQKPQEIADVDFLSNGFKV